MAHLYDSDEEWGLSRDEIEAALYSIVHYDAPTQVGKEWNLSSTAFEISQNLTDEPVAVHVESDTQSKVSRRTVQNDIQDDDESIVFAKCGKSIKAKEYKENQNTDILQLDKKEKRKKDQHPNVQGKRMKIKVGTKGDDGSLKSIPAKNLKLHQGNVSEEMRSNDMDAPLAYDRVDVETNPKLIKKKTKQVAKSISQKTLQKSPQKKTEKLKKVSAKLPKENVELKTVSENKKQSAKCSDEVIEIDMDDSDKDVIVIDDNSNSCDIILDQMPENLPGTKKTKEQQKKKKNIVHRALAEDGFVIDKSQDQKLSLKNLTSQEEKLEKRIMKRAKRLDKFKKKAKLKAKAKMEKKAKKNLKKLMRDVYSDSEDGVLEGDVVKGHNVPKSKTVLKNQQQGIAIEVPSSSAKDNEKQKPTSKDAVTVQETFSDSRTLEITTSKKSRIVTEKLQPIQRLRKQPTLSAAESVVVISDFTSDDEGGLVAMSDSGSNESDTDESLVVAGLLGRSKTDSQCDNIKVNMEFSFKKIPLDCSADVLLTKLLKTLGTYRKSDWELSSEDLYPSRGSSRYFTKQKIRCLNCNEWGHKAIDCPKPKKVIKCLVCGGGGHRANTCIFQQCYNCSLFGHLKKDCQFSYKSAYQVCHRCGVRGHIQQLCPERWRQFHSTNNLEKGYKNAQNKVHARGEQRSCCNCGGLGHSDAECSESKMEKYLTPFNLFIKTYEVAKELRVMGVKANPIMRFDQQYTAKNIQKNAASESKEVPCSPVKSKKKSPRKQQCKDRRKNLVSCEKKVLKRTARCTNSTLSRKLKNTKVNVKCRSKGNLCDNEGRPADSKSPDARLSSHRHYKGKLQQSDDSQADRHANPKRASPLKMKKRKSPKNGKQSVIVIP